MIISFSHFLNFFQIQSKDAGSSAGSFTVVDSKLSCIQILCRFPKRVNCANHFYFVFYFGVISFRLLWLHFEKLYYRVWWNAAYLYSKQKVLSCMFSLFQTHVVDCYTKFIIQWKPLNVITMGQRQTDYNNRLKIISEWT